MYRLISNNQNKIKTKDELINFLKQYKNILKDSVIDYLNSLIKLETSIIKNNITEEDRKILAEMEIYKDIAIYNIYNKTIKLLKKYNNELKIYEPEYSNDELKISAITGNQNIEIFNFYYGDGPMGLSSKIPDGYKTMNIGNISLYQTIKDEKIINEEKEEILKSLDILEKEENPYRYSANPNAYGGPDSRWYFEHNKKIKNLEERFYELEGKEKLSKEEKQEIELTQKYQNIILNDFGLKYDDFEEVEDYDIVENGATKLNKKLIKELPNLSIENNIKYI